jgi:tyrosine-protein kinase
MMMRTQAEGERNGNASSASHGKPGSRRLAQLSFPSSQSSAALHSGAEQERTPLARTLASARRNWVLLLVCVLLVPAAALVYSLLQTPEYTSSASVLFTDDLSEADPERVAATNLALGSLEQIAAKTASALPAAGYTAAEISDKVEANPAGMSDLIKISATDPDPELAAQIANEFADQFVAFRRSANRARILEAQALVEAQIDQLTPEERDSPEGIALAERKSELAVRAAAETGDAQVVQPATVPDSPSSPKTSRNVALGLLLGLALGIGLTLLRDQLDRRLKEPEEVEETFRLPILATIPQSQSIDAEGAGAEPVGEEREAFRMLRANLQYFNLEKPINSLLVTSPSSQDGKTTVSWNLSVAEAKGGKRVLHLEADLRRPNLASQLHLPVKDDSGLSLVLAGALEPRAAIQKCEGVDVICAGPLPPNPAELIDSQRMSQLLDWAKEAYDRVVIDTPPTAVVADAVPLTTQVDGVIVVVRLRHSPRDGAEHLRDQLAHTGSPTIGVVINGVARRPDDSYYRTPTGSESFSRAYDRLAAGGAEEVKSSQTR